MRPGVSFPGRIHVRHPRARALEVVIGYCGGVSIWLRKKGPIARASQCLNSINRVITHVAGNARLVCGEATPRRFGTPGAAGIDEQVLAT